MQYYASIACINIIALIILDYMLRNDNVTTIKVKRFFRLSILGTVVAIAAEIATMYFESAPVSYRVPNIVGNIVGFSISPLIPLLIGCAISNRKKKGTVLFWIPFSVNFFLSLLSSKFPIIFWVSHENTYSRGNLFGIYIAAYGAGIIYLLLETIAEKNRCQNRNRSILFILLTFVVLGTSIQVVAPQLHISWLCITFAMCLYYTYYCELYHQIDDLTELLNRHAYESHICKMNGVQDAAILFFDIDDFKSINDEHGHPFGDYCLVEISSRIKTVFFKIGLCFRIGGDEFCVITSNTDRAVIEHAYQKFLGEIVSMRKIEPRLPTVSIGHSFYDREKGTLDESILEADRQMYCFKQSRKKLTHPPRGE